MNLLLVSNETERGFYELSEFGMHIDYDGSTICLWFDVAFLNPNGLREMK